MEVNPNSPSDESTIQQPFGSPNSHRKGLGKPVIRKLLRDIEERGGIHTFSIKNLCDRFPETYGNPNTIQRRRVQNKVNKWKLLTLERFQAVQLKYLAIVGEERNHIPHSFAHPPASTTLERANSSDSSHHYFRRSLSPAVPNQEPPAFESPPPVSTIMLSSAMTIAKPVSTSKTAAHIQRALDSNDFVEIEVNIDRPEKNREVQVFNFMGVKTDGKFHNGYAIEMNVDVRDVKKGLYRAYLLPDNHHVFIKAPGLCASYRDDHKILADKEKLRSRFCEKLQDARDVSRHAIQDSEERTSKNIVLSFPGYMTLSNLIYSPGATDGLIKMKSEPYENTVILGEKEYETMHCRVVWKLHLVEAAERVFDKQEEKFTDEDELVNALNEAPGGSSGVSALSTPSPHSSDGTASNYGCSTSDKENVDDAPHSDSISVVLNNMMLEFDQHVSSLLDSPRTFRNNNFVGDQRFIPPPPTGLFLEGHVHYDLFGDTFVDMDIERGQLETSGTADTMLAWNDDDVLDKVSGSNILDMDDHGGGRQWKDTMLAAANDEAVLGNVSGDNAFL